MCFWLLLLFFILQIFINFSRKIVISIFIILLLIVNNAIASTGDFFSKGAPVAPWGLWLSTGDLIKQVASFPTSVGGLIVSKTDNKAQEDALRIKWTRAVGDQILLNITTPSDMSSQVNSDMELTFSAKSFKTKNASIQIGMCSPDSSCNQTLEINIVPNDWKEYRISLSCFDKLGIDMTQISTALMIKAKKGVDIGISNIRLTTDIDGKSSCEGN